MSPVYYPLHVHSEVHIVWDTSEMSEVPKGTHHVAISQDRYVWLVVTLKEKSMARIGCWIQEIVAKVKHTVASG